MAIFIGRRPETAFTRVPNEWARDPKLTTKAKGLLTYLLSHQDGYQLSLKQVIAENADGRDAIYKTLAELAERGYLRRDQRRRSGGTVGEVDYYVADAPVTTASGFTASGESGSGDDQGKRNETAGQTASWKTVSGSAVSGKPATKKTRVKKTRIQEDENTTSPNPSAALELADVVDAEIVEEEAASTSSLEPRIQKLIDDAVTAKPNWRRKRTEIRDQIGGLLLSFGENFDLVAQVVRETAFAADTGSPARITVAQNPAMVKANAQQLITTADAYGSGASFNRHPEAHPFEPKGDGSPACTRCSLPVQNQRHKLGDQAGGHIAQRAAGYDRQPHRTFQNPTDPNAYHGVL